MKKILSVIIIGVLLISGLGAVATPIDKNKHQKTSISFSNISTIEKEEYITIDMEGANSVLMKKNHYMLPTYIETFTFPFGTEIESIQCTPRDINSQQISKKLEISPDPVLINQKVINTDIKEIKIDNAKTPDCWFEYDVGTGIINKYERGVIVKIQVYPVQYDPSQNLIKWAESIDVDIEYNEPEQTITFEDDYLFLVLAKEEFSDELDDLVDHKIGRGISTIFVSLEDVYDGVHFPAEGRDNQERIKYFIKNAIENWGTSYVLLVGSSSKFPARVTHVHVDSNPPDNELFVSDLYYADIYDDLGGFCSWDSNENDDFGEYDWGSSHNFDDVDLFPDVFLGRLACTGSSQANTVVDKIITYETSVAYNQDWFGDIIVIGGDSFPGDDDSIDEGEYVNDAVLDVMDGFVPNRMWASEGDLSGIVPPGSTKLSNALNEGAGFVDFSGHGNPSTWATHPHEDENTWLPTIYGGYFNSHVAGLTNGDELPIVVIGACSVSKYNSASDCFGWAFVSNPNGGAIGSFGATGLGWAYIGTGVTQGLVEGMALNTFEAYKDEGALTFGEMWGKAITEYIHGGMEGTDYKTIEEWQPFGDPTLAIAEESNPPEKPEDLNGPTSGKINEEHTYTASTTDPDSGDELYYLFDWGNGDFSGWIGPYDSGDTASASYTWTEEGDYQIRVKAKDDHGAQSEWSDPLPITMPRNNAFMNSLLFQLLEKLMNRFPLIEQILSLIPVFS